MAIQETIREGVESLGPGFELIRELGRGTTAVVYLVRDHELDRDLAIKVIRSSYAHDEEAVARLQREARLVAQLQHPNIVRVFTTRNLPDGSLAILMEHVPGRNLKEVLRGSGPFPVRTAIGLLRDVASALAYAHRRRIVHRDVKPENIYLDEEIGTARLADFGIARPWDRDARLTVPGEALGTPAYMSPEQIDGDDVDGRTDVYSLGLVGYEMLTGEHPWETDNLFTIIFKQKNESLPPVDSVRSDVPRELAKALERALEKERERRWDSADALLQRLDELHRSEDSEKSGPDVWETTPYSAPRVPRPRRRRGSGRLLKAGLGALVLGAAGWGWLTWRGPTEVGWVDLPFNSRVTPAPATTDLGSSAPDTGQPAGATGLVAVGEELRSGQVGTSVPLTVRVPGPHDSTTVVRFRIVEGQGGLDREAVFPDELGAAAVNLQLPRRLGLTVVAARVEGPQGNGDEVRFAVVSTAGGPAEALSLLGDGQTATAGATLPEAIGVRVVDADGNPVGGTEVRFQVVGGSGTVTPAAVQTDPQGRAFARWRLGGSDGDQTAVAVVPAAGEAAVLFGATARSSLSASPGELPAVGIQPDDLAPETPGDGTAPPRPTVAVTPRPLAVGGTHTCLIGAQGFAGCMGARDRGQTAGSASGQIRLIALAAGVSHSCGLDPSGQAYCWGANESAQLGNGARNDIASASPIDSPNAFSTLALGLSHSCGIDSSGRVRCWGRNVSGQLGDGTRTDRTTPALASGPAGVTALTAGWNHTCAVAGSGQAYCWGLNAEGQLGEGSRVDRIVPTPVSGSVSFSALAAGNAHTCGLSNGIIYCWGANGSGQLGIGQTGGQPVPVRLESLTSAATQIVAGAVHTCALVQGGQAWCWGQNTHGQLGDGTNAERTLPTRVGGDLVFRSLRAGGGSTCGSTAGGQIYCWGLNQSGQLGDGTRTNRALPTRAGL